MEERLERMEDMLANLIRMVGDMKREQLETRQEIKEMKQDQKATREDIARLRLENEKHHNEISSRISSIELDHEHTWEKTVHNEREISKLKKKLDLIDFT